MVPIEAVALTLYQVGCNISSLYEVKERVLHVLGGDEKIVSSGGLTRRTLALGLVLLYRVQYFVGNILR